MRLPALALVLALGACGPDPDGNADKPPRTRCLKQTDCQYGNEYGAVCEDGYCSERMPAAESFSDMRMRLSNTVRLREPKSYRSFVIYPVRPDGKPVKCAAPNKGPARFDELLDPSKYNLTSYPTQQGITGSGDTIVTAVWVNGPNRVLYVEVYANPLDLTKPGEEGEAIGVACIDDAPSYPDPVNLEVGAPARE